MGMTETTWGVGPVGGVHAWTAATLAPGWRREFAAAEIDALDRALQRFREASPHLDLSGMTDDNFPVDELLGEIERIRTEMVDGQGVAVYEGFPVERYTEAELRAIWWGLCRRIGTPVPQSHRGDLIGDVRDIGTGISGKAGRGYTSNTELNFHSDASDMSGLFFLKTAREGGVTRIASSVAVHDRIAERRPDLLAELYKPLAWSWQSNQPEGEQGWYEMPVYGRKGDDVACAFVRTNILVAEANAGAPPMTDLQREAVELVASVAREPDLFVERTFEPGTMMFASNHTVFHLRTAFVDWDEPDRKRHLLRVWLSPSNGRALPDSFAPFFGDTSAGAIRGGYASRDGSYRYTTETPDDSTT